MGADSDTSFDEFVVAAIPRLRRVAYAWCHDWHQSDDVVQDTLERLYAAWPRVRRNGQEYAYARATLVHRLIPENRRAWRRHETTVDEQGLRDAADAHPVADSAEQALGAWTPPTSWPACRCANARWRCCVSWRSCR